MQTFLLVAATAFAFALVFAGCLLARSARRTRQPRDDFMFREDHWGM